jgi:hypothetical protein
MNECPIESHHDANFFSFSFPIILWPIFFFVGRSLSLSYIRGGSSRRLVEEEEGEKLQKLINSK